MEYITFPLYIDVNINAWLLRPLTGRILRISWHLLGVNFISLRLIVSLKNNAKCLYMPVAYTSLVIEDWVRSS